MLRESALQALANESQDWDVAIIGGGATGLGAAVEAASRGLRTVLVERGDFAKGTSSRSTKLVHGGVRYLQQMNITLVLDALRERGRMLHNAPHLVRDLQFVVPAYSWLDLPYYGAGLKVYELLSGKLSLGKSRLLSRKETMSALPNVAADGLQGGVLYHDGQFDDARYAIALLRTFQDLGGLALNYVAAEALMEEGGRVSGVRAHDLESGDKFDIRARAVINATGVFTEEILGLEKAVAPGSLLAVSQGSHVVLPREFLPTDDALMIPKTSDGRVLFAIPWHGHVIVGTTDEPVPAASIEPHAMEKEKTFLLDYVERFLGRRPKEEEILSVWSGLRPLIRHGNGSTSKLSRDHTILVSDSGLITIAGGKWTTYRKMGEDVIDRAISTRGLSASASRTASLPLHGYAEGLDFERWESVYGADLPQLEQLIAEDPQLAQLIHPRLPFRMGEVIWAARCEMARTTEDILARRTRALFLDARAAIEAAPRVASLLATELGRSQNEARRDAEAFLAVAQSYVYATPVTA